MNPRVLGGRGERLRDNRNRGRHEPDCASARDQQSSQGDRAPMASSAQAGVGGLNGYIAAHRTLDTYPTGNYRWGLMMLAVMATMVSFYEFGFPALLPLWIQTLHFTAEDFGYFLTFAVILSGVSAMAGGPLADRHGRVVVIYVCLGIII